MGLDFSGAILNHSTLSNSDFLRAKMMDAKLRYADLSRSRFEGTDLRRADLRGTWLHYTAFSSATLQGADFRKARLGFTKFIDVDLSEVIGLDEARHFAPSSIGIDTLLRSNGKISDEFLQKCGVPESTIGNFKAIAGSLEAIRFYSAFISYSSRDERFAQRLYSGLRDAGLRVWYAPEDLQPASKLHSQIDDAILVHDKLILVLSKNSMNSEWVWKELSRARMRERAEKKPILVPIRLCKFDEIKNWSCHYGSDPKDLADEVREYYIPDFSKWKSHDVFETELKKLIDALQRGAKRIS